MAEFNYEPIDKLALSISELRWLLDMAKEKIESDAKINNSRLKDIEDGIASIKLMIDDVDHELDKCKIFPD